MRCGNLHALDPLEAAGAVIEAMRSGCGCELGFLLGTDDDNDPLTEEAEAAPSKRALPRASRRVHPDELRVPSLPRGAVTRALRMLIADTGNQYG